MSETQTTEEEVVETPVEAEVKPAAEVKVKPLSDNAFVAFWQKIWRWWLGVWYGFEEKHPKLAKVVYQVFFFVVFSEGVTIFQILVLIFLPYLFGLDLAGTKFMFPEVPIKIGDLEYSWAFLGNEIAYDAEGNVVIGGGLGYFLAFKIATFLAQCINFPLQRNITYKSKGNPVYQAMWYFIGWVLINLACDAINNLWLPIANHYLPTAVSSILAMVAQGGIAMVIFFFIFLVIFPDLKKAYETAQKKADANPEDAELQLKATIAKEKYLEDDARKNVIATSSTADSKATVWAACVAKNLDQATIDEKYQVALEAAIKRDEAIAEKARIDAEVAAARAARA